MRLAVQFRDWVEDDDNFEFMAPVNFSLVCFRWNRGRLEEKELNQINELLLDRVNESGKVFLTHTSLRGKYVIRMAIGQRSTGEEHVRTAWEIIKKCAAEF